MNSVQAWIIAAFAAVWPFGQDEAADPRFYGYVEGRYVYVAPQSSGILETLDVDRGERVRKNARLFTLDDDKQRVALMKARASLTVAEANLENESTGKRPAEIAVIEEQLRSAKAQLVLAEVNYERSSELATRDFVSGSKLDQDHATRDAAAAAVEQQQAQLAVARLPARTAQLKAARFQVNAAQGDVVRAEINLAERRVAAPATGYVQDTYFLPGEFVSAGTPVVSILPPGEIRFLFFVGESQRAGLEPGTEVLVGCDGCDEPVRARISYLSSTAEFTPPVIYSLEERSKLVFRAEALPVGSTTLLPGQPIDVQLAAEAEKP